MEHGIIILRWAISYWYINEPAIITRHLTRQEHIVDILLNGIDEEADADDIVPDEADQLVKKGGGAFKWDHVPLELNSEALALFNDSGYPDDEAPSPRAHSPATNNNNNNHNPFIVAPSLSSSSSSSSPPSASGAGASSDIGGAFVGEPSSPNSSFHASQPSQSQSVLTTNESYDRPLRSGTASDMYQD
jgi:hypothetical protein